MSQHCTIEEVDGLSQQAFVELLGGIYEHSPWVAEAAYSERPFCTLRGLENAMRTAAQNADKQQQIAILAAHPEFAGKGAKQGTLTRSSSKEQSRLNLHALADDDLQRMLEFNRRFMDKFKFPGIVAVRLHDSVESIFPELERRIENDYDTEVQDGLQQVHYIARFRLHDLIADRAGAVQ